MTGRERMLTAINNKKPDRLPCQVHNWMDYYLKTYLDGKDAYEAYEFFDMDFAIYQSGEYKFKENIIANWQFKQQIGIPKDGITEFQNEYITPEGSLYVKGATNKYTSWEVEPMIKNEKDFELFKKYFPRPYKCDWSKVIEAKEKVGDRGIVRGISFSYGQLSPWQTLCYLMGTEDLIYKAFDEPEWVHYALASINKMYIDAVEIAGKIECDLIETGGGAGSSTVISPEMHKDFCLPYDIELHKAIKEQGTKIVYHLCGGHMPLLDMVAKNGADCLETLTPPGMGADCVLSEATKKVGNKLAFIGGFDQLAGFERGTPKIIEEMVQSLFNACPDGGYICSPSDHFFEGSIENIKSFVNACKNCKY